MFGRTPAETAPVYLGFKFFHTFLSAFNKILCRSSRLRTNTTQMKLCSMGQEQFRGKKRKICKNTLLTHLHLWLEERNPLPLAIWWRLMGAVGQRLLSQICSNIHILNPQQGKNSLDQNHTGTCSKQSSPEQSCWVITHHPVISYHLPNVREQPVTKILSRLNRQLGGQVIDGAHENAVTFHAAQRFEKKIW